MPVKTINFEPDFIINPENGKLDFIYRPYLFIKLGNKSKWSMNFIRSLLDTGADFNTFPASFAKEINLDYKKGKKRETMGFKGESITTYLNIVSLKIDSKIIETAVCFGEEVKTPLLGRQGFFNFFDRISFKTKDKIVELKY